ncbi:MAG: hypothetical protein ACRECU_02170 [Methylocella sp.]
MRRFDSIEGIWGAVIADSLVAVGVASEILFSRLGFGRQYELQRRSGEKVATTNKIAALANERAATLEKEVVEARERTAQIEKLTAWRRISPEQQSTIVAAIREIAQSLDVLIEHERGDPEAFSYARDFASMINSAGVTKIRFGANSYLHPVFGLRTALAPETDMAILEVFGRVGILLVYDPMDLSRHLTRNETAPNWYIFVAPKPPPPMAWRPTPHRESSI